VALSVGVNTDEERGNGVLCNALVVPFTSKQPMNNHDRVALGLAAVVMEPIREVYRTQAC